MRLARTVKAISNPRLPDHAVPRAQRLQTVSYSEASLVVNPGRVARRMPNGEVFKVTRHKFVYESSNNCKKNVNKTLAHQLAIVVGSRPVSSYIAGD